jgi:hypothetical protein
MSPNTLTFDISNFEESDKSLYLLQLREFHSNNAFNMDYIALECVHKESNTNERVGRARMFNLHIEP